MICHTNSLMKPILDRLDKKKNKQFTIGIVSAFLLEISLVFIHLFIYKQISTHTFLLKQITKEEKPTSVRLDGFRSQHAPIYLQEDIICK